MRRATKTPKNAVRAGHRVIVYVRVSSIGDRGEDLISDDVQLNVCRNWANQSNVAIVDVVADLDMSGRDFAKRKIAEIIERIRRGEADGVLVWKISRFGRNTLDSLLNIRTLQEAGGRIASGTENLDDIETAMGRFSLTQMLAIAQLQSDQIGETWQNIHAYRRSLGLPHTGGPRFGYDYHKEEKDPKKVFTPNPVTGPWLAKAYREVVAGRAVASIVTELWEKGIRSVRGNRITYRSLMATLDSGFGAGLLVDKSSAADRSGSPHTWTFSPGAHEPVIAEEVWTAYLARRAEPRAPRERAAAHRLSGLVYCGTCKRKTRIIWKYRTWPQPTQADARAENKYRAFHCAFTSSVNTTLLCTDPPAISQELLEDEVLAWLRTHTEGGDTSLNTAVARKAAAERARADIEALDKEIARLDKRRKRAVDDYLDEDDDALSGTLRIRAKELEAEIADLKRQKQELAAEADASEVPPQAAFDALVEAWEHMELSMLNQMLRQVIRRVEVYPRSGNQRVRVIGRWEVDDDRPRAKSRRYWGSGTTSD